MGPGWVFHFSADSRHRAGKPALTPLPMLKASSGLCNDPCPPCFRKRGAASRGKRAADRRTATAPTIEEASMRKHERGRRTPGAALSLAVAGGAMILALGGCGQSGPLYLPEKASLAASVEGPVAKLSIGPGTATGEDGAAAVRLAPA